MLVRHTLGSILPQGAATQGARERASTESPSRRAAATRFAHPPLDGSSLSGWRRRRGARSPRGLAGPGSPPGRAKGRPASSPSDTTSLRRLVVCWQRWVFFSRGQWSHVLKAQGMSIPRLCGSPRCVGHAYAGNEPNNHYFRLHSCFISTCIWHNSISKKIFFKNAHFGKSGTWTKVSAPFSQPAGNSKFLMAYAVMSENLEFI